MESTHPSGRSPAPTPWRLCVDTGGTFTDCVAFGPAGQVRRAKVLSTSALRGVIARVIDARTFEIQERWGAPPGLAQGFQFRLLRGTGSTKAARIARHSADPMILELEQACPGDPIAGDRFEVVSNEPAPILAARLATGAADGPLPPVRMRLATTRGTNALLQRNGAPTALVITAGFGDLLEIGDQQRPELFALAVRKPRVLHEHVIEAEERLDAVGGLIRSLNAGKIRDAARRLFKLGVRTAAVALMHGHMNPVHEHRVREILLEEGFLHVSCSSDIAPLIRLLSRAQTTVVNAYLAPVIENYVNDVRRCLGSDSKPDGSDLHMMTSSGGLAAAAAFRPCDSLFSGPAGGIAGAAAAARRSGFDRFIGFDMGGTSTDVARHGGDFEYRFEQKIGDVRLMSPALAIETVAAGGGSVCDVVGEALVVGPHSAGASPGPACYGAGGPLTITDVNLLLGRVAADQFEIPVDPAASAAALRSVASKHPAFAARSDEALVELAGGFLAIANQRMAGAIEQVSVRQGYDPADHALLAFGGAGGQHACAVADLLGMRTVIVPADASLLSAAGLDDAVLERISQFQVLRPLQECHQSLAAELSRRASAAADELARDGVEAGDIIVRRVILNARLLGQDSTLALEFGPFEKARDVVVPSLDRMHARFRDRFGAMYGHEPSIDERRPVEIESARVIVSERRRAAESPRSNPKEPSARPAGATRLWASGRWLEAPAFRREALEAGAAIDGPALVLGGRTAMVIEPGWQATIDAAGAMIARRAVAETSMRGIGVSEAFKLDLFSNSLGQIAREMGDALQRTALSTNVKERLDFSCAVLDASGNLVVNAPHIPVHLGAMGVCVREVARVLPMKPGDVVITNHPAYGGSHLPDVTIITPVFDEASRLLGHVASRAHHAEIGGTRPGSMPPAARSLAEEGVVIPPRHLVREGLSRFDELERLLRESPHPSRAVVDNLADCLAAVVANRRGARQLAALAASHGKAEFERLLDAILERAESAARQTIRSLSPGVRQAQERLDDGSVLSVALAVESDRLRLDFAGSAGVHPGNLNATPAIVRSVVMYVLRLLVGRDLPLNEGMMRAVAIDLPRGMLNPPFPDDPRDCPAVVGGNTEVSQRLVDVLLKALGACAASQGTMNNLLFGDGRFGYYETVCGGCGAGPDFDGADAVHSHMTNTRITDPEVIEHRYPIRVERFAVRRGSGGRGRHRGGDGVVRELRFLAPLSLSLLTQRRTEGPYGLEGGRSGTPGRQRLIRADGAEIELGSIDAVEAAAGDRLILETPGGGGFGA